MLALALLSLGCVPDSVQAPYGSEVLTPLDVEFGWNDTLNEFDLAGTVFFLDVMVIGPDGLPLEHVEVETTSSYAGVYILPQESVELVGYPTVPDAVQSQEDVKEYCTDEDGNYSLTEDWCAWYWDVVNNQFYAFAGTYADAYEESEDGTYWYAPTFMIGKTDGRGVMRVFGLVDTLAIDGSGYSTAQLYFNIGVDAATISLTPIGEVTEDAEDTEDTEDTGGDDTGA